MAQPGNQPQQQSSTPTTDPAAPASSSSSSRPATAQNGASAQNILNIYDLPEITNLDTFEYYVDKTCSELITARIYVETQDLDRLTGTLAIREMNQLAQDIEQICRTLDADENLSYDHHPDVHLAMDKMKQFRPYFLVQQERRQTTVWWEESYDNFSGGLNIQLALQQMVEKGTAYRICDTEEVIDKDNYLEYQARLTKIRERTRDSQQDVYARLGYLNSEKRVSARLLLACRRFKTAQRNRSSSVPVCRCRGKDWERAFWKIFGFPAMNVSPGGGPRGFIPL
ncbi:hypothetical protein TWF506_002507 [Arthrobotrys conoides]|uniref:Uncharacterized protein n=1 Tax=Arthrobotrys conoides TaxID=74498 RepID=A0AAN8MZW7_9PEZI